MIAKVIFIFELYLVLFFISYRLFYYIRRDRLLNERRKRRIIAGKSKKPEMRDPILKRG